MFTKLLHKLWNFGQQQNVVSADIKNVDQDHHLKKIIISRLLHNRFYPNFRLNDAIGAGSKSVTSADL